jgi:holo-[acyl-carrier protein] synthase
MIYGIGIDVIQPQRVARLFDKYGERFVCRVLTPQERLRFELSRQKVQFLANRFAAKEAFSKAMGTGFRYPVTLQNISVVQNPLGKPELAFSNTLSLQVNEAGICGHHLTISDESSMACACVVLEK